MLSKEMKLDIKIPLPNGNKIEFLNCVCEVFYNIQKGSTPSFYDPGLPDNVNVEKVLYDGEDITDLVNTESIESRIDIDEEIEELKFEIKNL